MAASNPRIRAIEIEASRRAGADGKNSRAERFDIRNQLRAEQGFGAEKRKRGGLAGTWDRNKGVIKPIATAAAGAFGGPGLAALLGGAMGGLDREGKGGIGFDVGGGLKGAVTGAAAGAAGAGLRGMFTGGFNPSGFMGGVKDYAGKIPGVKAGFTKAPAPPITGDAVANASHVFGAGGRPVVNALKGAGAWMAKNPTVVGSALTAGANMAGQSGQNRIQRERFAMEKSEFDRQNAQRERMRQLLMPYFTMLQQRLGGSVG